MSKWKEKIALVCDCGESFTRRRDYLRKLEKQGKPITCTKCSNSRGNREKWASYSHETKAHIVNSLLKGGDIFRASLTPEEITERSRKGGEGNRNNNGFSVRRQWETIKADPFLYSKACRRLTRLAHAFRNRWEAWSEEEKAAHLAKIFAGRGNGRSLSGDRFIRHLLAEGIPLKPEAPIHGFLADGLHEPTQTIIEFYGDVWHCNPLSFKDPNVHIPWLNRTVAQQWARDRKRLGVFYRYGYTVIIVWESDWKEDPQTQIRRIKHALSIS